MFDRLQRILNKIETRPIELSFLMDLMPDGKHNVRVFRNTPEGPIQVNNLEQFMSFNYQEEKDEPKRKVIMTVKDEDRQTYLSLCSLNPEKNNDGGLVFEIEPPILKYLRSKVITETANAQKVKIFEDAIKPTAEISYSTNSGINVNTGYRIHENEPLIPANELELTKDGAYTKIENSFHRLGKVNSEGKSILEKGKVNYPLEKIPEFFMRDLVLIKKEFNAVLTDLAESIKISENSFNPLVHVSKDAQGWLNFKVDYDVDGFKLPRKLVIEAQRKGEYMQVDPFTWVKLDTRSINKTEAKLDLLEAELTNEGFRLPASEFASLEEFLAAIGGKSIVDDAYQTFIDQLTDFQTNPSFSLSESIEHQLLLSGLQLRPYQRAGIHWLDWLRTNQLHGLLADDMGLGKTLQSLVVLRNAYEKDESQNHSLIIAPKSVLLHWRNEIERVFGSHRYHIYYGSNRNRRFFSSKYPYIFITTYETVSRDESYLRSIPFFYLILDEATRIKNPDAQRSQSIKALNAKHRIALSGTPVENRPRELWSLYDFLMRGHLGKQGTFIRVFEESILSGETETARRLGRRIKPFLLRRKKDSVAGDLPPKIVLSNWVELTEEQRNLYGAYQDQIKNIRNSLIKGEFVNYASNILPVLQKLKQICDHPALVTGEVDPITGRSEKFDQILDKVEEIIENGEQVLIFSHFLNMLSLLETEIRNKGISYIRIDGGSNHRQELIDQFNQGKAKVAILSIMAAGYGINMTAANHVIHADRWWNPAVEDQATDRVHRIGQNKTVFVYHFLTTCTLEEKIDTLLTRKRGVADEIIKAATEGEHKWTREDLIELLTPLE